MRNRTAKKLRREVMLKMYVGDDVTAQDIIDSKHDVMGSRDFKRVFRARKRNYKSRLKAQVVNHMTTGTGYDERAKRMFDVRMKNRKS